MGYIDKYRRRITRTGNDVGEAYKNNTIAFIEATFHKAPTFRVMEVDAYYLPETIEMDARVVEIERLGTLREVILRPSDSLEVGTYVKFDGDTWLLFDKYGGTGATNIKLLAIKCNRQIKWKDKDGNVKEYSCNASATDLGSKSKQSKNEIEWNKYDVRLPLGQLFISMESNPDTSSIKLNQRFVFGRNVYEVTGIDDVTSIDDEGRGIIQLTVKITTQRDGDFVDGIAVNEYKTDGDIVAPITQEDKEDEGRLW
jgi:hypothetical protein